MQKRTLKNKLLVKQEVDLGRRLFEARGKRSEVSGQFLGDEYDHVFASHILTKQASPKFRLYHKNIVLMTFAEHHLWEFERHLLIDRPEWKWVFRLYDLLREEYNRIKHYNVL